MKNAELKVVCFDNSDVIATSASCNNLGAGWSTSSYKPINSVSLKDGIDTNYNGAGIGTVGEYYNFVNGVGSNNSDGEILNTGYFYHYNEDSVVGEIATEFWKCDNSSHCAQ